MLKILSSIDDSIWDLEIDVSVLKFVVSNDKQKYESDVIHFQQIDLNENLIKVFDFYTQQKIVNKILEVNQNFSVQNTWMKKNIYKTDENEILAFHITDNEYKYAIFIEMKKVE
jgi:hypothetical protein